MLGNRFTIVELQVVAHRNLAISRQKLVVTGYLVVRAVHRVRHKIADPSYATVVNLDYNEFRAGRPLLAHRAKGHLARVDHVPVQASRLPEVGGVVQRAERQLCTHGVKNLAAQTCEFGQALNLNGQRHHDMSAVILPEQKQGRTSETRRNLDITNRTQWQSTSTGCSEHRQPASRDDQPRSECTNSADAKHDRRTTAEDASRGAGWTRLIESPHRHPRECDGTDEAHRRRRHPRSSLASDRCRRRSRRTALEVATAAVHIVDPTPTRYRCRAARSAVRLVPYKPAGHVVASTSPEATEGSIRVTSRIARWSPRYSTWICAVPMLNRSHAGPSP